MRFRLLNEMAHDRALAIEFCMDMGAQFIEHFHKVYREGISSDNFQHHCAEMQAWLDKCRKINLKSTKQYLTAQQLFDWFFTAGGLIDADNGFQTVAEIQAYTRFSNILASNRLTKVEDVARQLLSNQ